MSGALSPDTIRAIEHDCAKLVARYANRNDAADWVAVAALYAPDGRMARPTAPDDWIAGREAILAAFKVRPPRVTGPWLSFGLSTFLSRKDSSS